jgi:hypothetical protein
MVETFKWLFPPSTVPPFTCSTCHIGLLQKKYIALNQTSGTADPHFAYSSLIQIPNSNLNAI